MPRGRAHRAPRGPRAHPAAAPDRSTRTGPWRRRRRSERRPRAGTTPEVPRASRSPASHRPGRTSRRSRATAPAAIAGATSGTTMRLTTGARRASRPNDARTIGSVAAWAASDTPRFSDIQPGSRPRVARSIAAVSGEAHARRPAVAAVDSWKPASPTRAGSASSSTTAAQPSAAAALPARPVSRAKSTTPAIAAARRTDGEAPAKATYPAMAAAVRIVRLRRPSLPPSAATDAATIAMFQPEMATTWLIPAVVKSAATSRSTRSLRPMRIPAASPASGSGSARARASAEERRSCSRRAPASSPRPVISSDRERMVPVSPVLRR